MSARLESLDLLANNIANSSTTGYKADREAFIPWTSVDANYSPADPTESPFLDRQWTDHSQGALSRTGEPLDMALQGRGYFEVQTPSGARSTRNGTFHVNTQGKLETAEGYLVRVKPPEGRQYSLDPSLPIEIGTDGTIRQGNFIAGVVDIRDFDSLDGLQKQGASYFRMDSGTSKAAAGFELKQGYLEGANSGVADSSVRLVSVMRQFEALQKAASIGADMNRKVVEEVARVTP